MVWQKIEETILERFNKDRDVTQIVNGYFKYKRANGAVEECAISEAYVEHASSCFKARLHKYIPKDFKGYIAGGSVADFFLHGGFANIKDFDIFPTSKEEFDKIETHLNTIVYQEVNAGLLSSCSSNNFSKKYELASVKIDVIHYEPRLTPTLEELLDSFDINVCKFGFTIHENWKFVKCCEWVFLFNRRLDFRDSIDFQKEGLGTLNRLMRYYGKGFKLQNERLASLYARIATVNNPEKYTEEVIKQEGKVYMGEYDFLDGKKPMRTVSPTFYAPPTEVGPFEGMETVCENLSKKRRSEGWTTLLVKLLKIAIQKKK